MADDALVDGAAGGDELLGFEGEGAEGLLVLGEIVVEYVGEGLSLLGAEVDSLKVAEFDLFGGVLGHGSEDEEEVPDAHADLNAVGVTFAVVGGGGEADGRLRGVVGVGLGMGWGLGHENQLSGGRWKGWCERGDLNPHGFLRQILSLVRLPISPLSRGEANFYFPIGGALACARRLDVCAFRCGKGVVGDIAGV